MQRLRTILLVIIVLALLALVARRFLPSASNRDSTEMPEVVQPKDEGPLAGTGLRFDGYYMEQRGKLLYLVRFFPEGKAVLVNGTDDLLGELPALLVRDAKGDPSMGYYNVPVQLRNDSLFFTTTPEKGTIDYSGIVVDRERVRLLRHSNINGTEQLKEYLFTPDALQQ